MNVDNKFVVFLLALLMSVSLIGASGAIAVDRTVLDADQLSDSIDREGVYEDLAVESRENVSRQIEMNLNDSAEQRPEGIEFNFDSDEIAAEAVTAEFFAEEFNRNIEQFIAFLEGETDELELSINLSAIYESVIKQFTADSISVNTVPVAQAADLQSTDSGVNVTDAMIEQLNDNETGYQSVRTDIRAQGLGDVPVAVDESGSVRVDAVTLAQEGNLTSANSEVNVTDAMIERLNEDAEGYRSVRVDIRSQALQGVPAEVTDTGEVDIDTVALAQESDLGSASNDIEITDEMIARVNEDADGYATVRQDIRTQVRESLPPRATETQVNQALRDANEDIKRDAETQVEAEYGDNVTEETLQNMIALQNTVIDGLTNPDLDSFEEYDRRRTEDERAVEASLTDEIDSALRETNDEVSASAAQDARETYRNDVSNETLQDIINLQDTVIDGLTDPDLSSFDDYATQRDADERALETSLDAEVDTALQEANAEVKENATAQLRAQYDSEVSNETLQDIAALQNTVIDGLTDPGFDSFAEYETQRDANEDALEESLASEIRTDIRAQVDNGSSDRINLSDGLNEDSSQLSRARSVVRIINLFTVVLPVVLFILIGILYGVTRSPSRTGRATGYAVTAAGLIGVIGGLIAPGPIIDSVAPETANGTTAQAALTDAFASILKLAFDAVVTQSAVLTALGFVLIGGVYLERTGVLSNQESESSHDSASGDSDAVDQDGERSAEEDAGDTGSDATNDSP